MQTTQKQGGGHKLSHEDIKSLMENPTVETKVRIIKKLSEQYINEGFSQKQLELAEQIFRLLIRQAEIEVRKALSENLMTSKAIPHDVVFMLARDVEEVSLPVLEFSEVLKDEDLIEIIKTTDTVTKWSAIASRKSVSENVSEALVETNSEEVMETLLDNDGAEVSEESYEKMINEFNNSEKVVEAVMMRGDLPSGIVQQMAHKVSQAIQEKLEKKYKYSFENIHNFFQESGEIAALRFMGMQAVDHDFADMVDGLEQEGDLDEALEPGGKLDKLMEGIDRQSLVTPLAAIATGNLMLFELCISRQLDIPFRNVQRLMSDKEGGLRALYQRAELPAKLFDATKLAVYVIQKMERRSRQTGSARARDNLHLFLQQLTQESRNRKVPHLSHFIAMVRHHIDRGSLNSGRNIG